MLRFLLVRALQSFGVIVAVFARAFSSMRVAPGSPFDAEQALPAAVVANQAQVLGMARPVPVGVVGRVVSVTATPGQRLAAGEPYATLEAQGQRHELTAPEALVVFRVVSGPGTSLSAEQALLFARTGLVEELLSTLGSWLRFDFGVTVRSGGARTVAQNLRAGLPVSVELGLYALVLALLAGIPLGLLAGAYPGSALDRVVTAFLLLGISIPSLVLAPLLIAVFVMWLGWAPPHGGWEPGLFYDLGKKALPSLALALPYAAAFGRLVRGAMADVRREEWYGFLTAKGLRPSTILVRHALKPALVPLSTYLGPALASLLTGSFVVERVFQIPGISMYFVDSALERDYPMVMGVIVVYSSLLVVANLGVDLLHAWLDPRVRAQ